MTENNARGKQEIERGKFRLPSKLVFYYKILTKVIVSRTSNACAIEIMGQMARKQEKKSGEEGPERKRK